MEAPVEGYAVNGTLEEQAAPQALAELQAAVQDAAHAIPVVDGAYVALAAGPQVRAWTSAAALEGCSCAAAGTARCSRAAAHQARQGGAPAKPRP